MPVVGFEIVSREPFENGAEFGDAGAYERIDARAHFAADPLHAANEEIVDLELAARDEDGRVRFEADVTILQPVDPDRGNRLMLQDVVNRGGRTFVSYNLAVRDASRPNWIPVGDGYLMRQGWTIVCCGWQWDVIRGTGLVGLEAPEAFENGRPIEGEAAVTHQIGERASHLLLADRAHQPLLAADLEQPDAVLTVRDYPDAPRTEIPREQWRFARIDDATGRLVADERYIALEGGFAAGPIYEIILRTKRSPVVGAGMLSFRDVATFLRYSESPDNPLAGRVDHAIAAGSSQSGRFLRTFLLHGMNTDEDGRQAFDGMHIHIAGARRGEFNHRYGQPSVQYTYGFGHRPPFGYDDAEDPITRETIPGLLARQRSLGGVPLIVATNTAAEYWRGDAGLLHIDLSGSRDLPDTPGTRTYLFASTQHGSGQPRLTDTPPTGGARGAHALNITHYGPLLRGALAGLARWVVEGIEPPPSVVPRLADATASTREAVIEAVSAFPGATAPSPERLYSVPRLDLGAKAGAGIGSWPPDLGERFPTLVSAVDEDGNEIGGIRLPDVSVPLATLLGWNPRNSASGGDGQILEMSGSTLPFEATLEDRERSGDPRRSVQERYDGREHYLSAVRVEADALAASGYILEEDIEVILRHAEARWELLAVAAVTS